MPSIRLDATLALCATLVAQAPALSEAASSTPAWRSLGDPYWEGAAWTARAETLRGTAPLEARAAFEGALRSWRTAGATREEAHTLVEIGTLLQGAGRPDEALPRFEEALARARSASAPDLEARALNGVGESRALLIELQAAFDAFTELLALHRRLGNPAGEVEALGNLGYVYLQLGDYVEAVDSFRRALPAAREMGARGFEATLLNNIGQALYEQGDLDGAGKAFEESLALRPADDPGRAYAMVNLSNICRQRGDYARSLELLVAPLESFRAAGNRRAQAITLDNLGATYTRLGEAARAYELHMQAIAVRDTGGVSVEDMGSLHFAAQAELRRGRLEEARGLSERALTLVESVRREQVQSRRLRASLLAPTRVVYEGYVDVLMQLHRTRPGEGLDALAFDVGERARARSLLELLADAGARPGEEGRPQRWAQPLTLAELRGRALDGETAVLTYLLGDERSYVWAWTGEFLVAQELPARATLAELARRTHERLAERPGRTASAGARPSRELEKDLAELSRVLLSPVAAQLGSRRIAVVADGPLHYVPFAALPDPVRPDLPLLEGHEVVTLPSVSALAMLREGATGEARPTRRVAVFADPVFDADDERVAARHRARAADPAAAEGLVRPSRLHSSVRDVEGGPGAPLGRLPFTRREAEGILKLAGRKGSRGALDFDASLAAVHAPDLADFRYVHFATHGLLNNERPELSGLVLSLAGPDGRPRDGFLSVEDILKLRWRADLVTLSGCRTGLGRSVRGEGLVGMTRAFMVAGAPRVVASLWSVDDSATAELMKGFYAEMLGPAKRSPAAALRHAQLGLRKTRAWAAPYYWAAFQLHGDWR